MAYYRLTHANRLESTASAVLVVSSSEMRMCSPVEQEEQRLIGEQHGAFRHQHRCLQRSLHRAALRRTFSRENMNQIADRTPDKPTNTDR